VNGSAAYKTTAITVTAQGSLTLGQDHSGRVTGTVQIGNGLNASATNGWNGIACTSVNPFGCTISDADLTGQSSVIIEGQENDDISAGDFAFISLTSAPVIGLSPAAAGFLQCPGKPDGTGVDLGGSAMLLFSHGTVQW
jgi:hypothetical protein